MVGWSFTADFKRPIRTVRDFPRPRLQPDEIHELCCARLELPGESGWSQGIGFSLT